MSYEFMLHFIATIYLVSIVIPLETDNLNTIEILVA